MDAFLSLLPNWNPRDLCHPPQTSVQLQGQPETPRSGQLGGWSAGPTRGQLGQEGEAGSRAPGDHSKDPENHQSDGPSQAPSRTTWDTAGLSRVLPQKRQGQGISGGGGLRLRGSLSKLPVSPKPRPGAHRG